MATEQTAQEASGQRKRFAWLWTVEKLIPGEDKKCSGEGGTVDTIPMEVGDRLMVFFLDEHQVCFHKRSRDAFANDAVWQSARGVFNADANDHTGQIVAQFDDGRFVKITLNIDADGKGTLTGTHYRNPGDGGWIARD